MSMEMGTCVVMKSIFFMSNSVKLSRVFTTMESLEHIQLIYTATIVQNFGRA